MTAATIVDRPAIEAWFAHYGLGALRELTPTNNPAAPYLLATAVGRYRLVLPAQTDSAAFCLALRNLLADAGLPCARVLMTREGRATQPLAGRAAALLPGPAEPRFATSSPAQCAALGETLARLHVAARDFGLRRENPQGLPRWRALASALESQLDEESNILVSAELRYQALYRFADLPRGTVHGHPLPGHLAFDETRALDLGELTYACTDSLLVDVALAVAGWAGTEAGIDAGRGRALLDAYHACRPLTPIERGGWPTVLRSAALQLWLEALAAADATRAASHERLLRWLVAHEKDVRALWPRTPAGGG